jgi:hypothetical protein
VPMACSTAPGWPFDAITVRSAAQNQQLIAGFIGDVSACTAPGKNSNGSVWRTWPDGAASPPTDRGIPRTTSGSPGTPGYPRGSVPPGGGFVSKSGGASPRTIGSTPSSPTGATWCTGEVRSLRSAGGGEPCPDPDERRHPSQGVPRLL